MLTFNESALIIYCLNEVDGPWFFEGFVKRVVPCRCILFRVARQAGFRGMVVDQMEMSVVRKTT